MSPSGRATIRCMTEQNPKALIVDDDPTVLRIMQLCLEEIDFDTELAGDFEQFRQRLDDRIDFVVLDLKMPDANGVDIMRYLSRSGYQGRVTIVSGVGAELRESAENLARRYGLRITGSLRKPFRPLELQRHLNRYIHPRVSASTRNGLLLREDAEQLANGGFLRAYYQPKINLKDGSLAGFEALLRCRHPKLGLLGPASFAGVLDESPVMDRVNLSIFEVVLQDMARWQSNGLRQQVAINIGARQLGDLNLPDVLRQSSRRYGIDLSDLTVEVTETTFTAEMVRALDVLIRLRLYEVGLSIDDFGTGYSTEDRLRDLPFTELKIDGGLVRHVATDPDSRNHVRRCVELGRRLGLTVVAEWVEQHSQVEALSRLGVDQAQGYLFAEPMPAEEVPGWCESLHRVSDILVRAACSSGT